MSGWGVESHLLHCIERTRESYYQPIEEEGDQDEAV
jgi:hypothetical protein